MTIKEAINARKSIRKYKDKPIPEDVIKELLEAARLAPSAENTQSHKYWLVKDQTTKNKLLKYQAFGQPFVYEAPLILVCCADPSAYPDSTDPESNPNNYAHMDLAIATSFLVLRATELGLGSVFIAWIERDKIKEALHIPKHYILPFVIPLGYPDENPPARPRKAIKEIIIK